ncbi:MAG: hypothetical protein ACRCXT_06690 [Paraclostridium sp.]
MITWEIKKILKDKSSIIAFGLMIVLFLQISFIKPMLETQNEYFDEAKNEYVIDDRSKEEIANEKLDLKINMINSAINSPDSDKSLADISKEKIQLDNGKEYKDVDFYKVFTERLDFSLSIIIMMIIIIMLVSNIYTDEVVYNVSPMILSSNKKNKVLYSKLIIAIILPLLIYGIYVGGTASITYMQYGKSLNGNLQAYRIIDIAILAKAITINQYAISKIITTSLMLTGISVISLLISFLSNNSVKSISLSVAFIAIGKILTLFKFLPELLLLVLSTGNYIDITMGMSKISGFYSGHVEILSQSVDVSNLIISIYGLIVIAGILGCFYTIKKVLTK